MWVEVEVVIVVVVGVTTVVATVGKLASWMKKKQTTSPAGPGPWPCPSLASENSGSFAYLGPLLQKQQETKKKS